MESDQRTIPVQTCALATTLLWASLFSIVLTTLFPFDMVWRVPLALPPSGHLFDLRILKGDAWTDIPRNILLFIPLGMGLATRLRACGNARRATLFWALAGGVGLSLAVELAQLLLPARQSSLSDLLTNGLGTAAGILLARTTLWQATLHRLAQAPARLWRGLAIAHLVIVLLGSATVARSVQIAHWEPDYPLLLGNESTGDRPWSGRIRSLTLQATATTPPLIRFDIQTVAGQSDWEAAGETGPPVTAQGVAVGPEGWLINTVSGAPVVGKVEERGEFLLQMALTPETLRQGGPARIFSWSDGPFTRNLTVGQESADVAIRMRTALTGMNGMQPEIVLAGRMRTAQPAALTVRYDGSTLSVDGDWVRGTIWLTPDTLLLHPLLCGPACQVRIQGPNLILLVGAIYGVIFLLYGRMIGHADVISPSSGAVWRLWQLSLPLAYGLVGNQPLLMKPMVIVLALGMVILARPTRATDSLQ